MRASANLGSTSVSVVPGSTATVPVTVRNSSDTVEAYKIEILGDTAEWTTVEPAEVTLYPAGSTDVQVTFAPPRSARIAAGERPFGVRVVPAEYPDATVVQEGTVTIEPFREISAQLQPGSRSGRKSARYRIDTDNHGNVAEPLTFFADDSTNQLTFALRPDTAEVGNGTRSETALSVKARRWLWWGAPREYRFTTEVRSEGGRPIAMEGVFVQKPVISAGLIKLLAAILAVLLALLLLWFLLVRPAVKSAAKEAVDAQATKAAQDAQLTTTPPDPTPTPSKAGTGSGAQGGGQQGGGSGSSGGGNGATGTGGGSNFSASINFRTAKGGSATRSYTVPKDQTFMLTDFLVDNIQGDEGTLQVIANGVPVVTYALENFRNQDYHSVTPIRIPTGAKVSMTVACRLPGTPANAAPATSCREALYLNGIMNKNPVASTAPAN